MPSSQDTSARTRRARERAEKPAAARGRVDVYQPDLRAWWDATPESVFPEVGPHTGAKLEYAQLWFGKFNERGKLKVRESGRRDYETRVFRGERQIKQAVDKVNVAVRESARASGVPVREDGGDYFAYGSSAPYLGGYSQGPLLDTYVPMIPGPFTRQQYWADYWATSAKAFEAYHHDPIAHRAVNLLWQFVLGKGAEVHVKGDRGQQAWDEFAKRNKIDERINQVGRDLSVFGEQFLQYFQTGRGSEGLEVRALDPATIYEVVTDQEDVETVFYYHQQYATRTQLEPPPPANRAPQGPTTAAVTKYVVRQIPAEDVDHYKINVTAAEARGRSDLFSALGYLKRLRDYMTSKVVKADMEARFVYDIAVSGDQAQVGQTLRALFPNGQPPAPGTPLGHNTNVELKPIEASHSSTNSQDATLEMLINLVAVGIGVPKEYLGIQGHGSRATALVATEPAAKLFEDRQKVVEGVLADMAGRVFAAAGLSGDDADVEITFPGIVTEDRSALMKDLAFAESMGWISKERAAQIAAKELDVTTFDWDEELQAIAAEFDKAKSGVSDDPEADDPQGDGVIRRPMISAQFRQEPKLDPTKPAKGPEDQPPGLLVPPEPGQAPASSGAAQKTTAGMPADENPLSPAGAKNIRQDNAAAKEAAVWISRDDLAVLLREAVAAGRAPRRRPDDSGFAQHARGYRDRTAENLAELVSAVEKQ